jgi:signal transduction histidine kinase
VLYALFFFIAGIAIVLALEFVPDNPLIGHSSQAAGVPPTGPAQDPGTIAVVSNHDINIQSVGYVVLLAAVALVVGRIIAARVLSPLRTITATANEISAADLGRRLDVDGPRDEITELGRTLDGLFARLQAAFDSQRHFVANASHELRTPLSAERTVLQVALADPDADTETLRAACRQALALGEHQQRLIDALLTLAEGERGIEHREPFDLAELAGTALAELHDRIGRRALRVTAVLGSAPSTGDPRLAASLVTNLVANAVRHNHSGGSIEIRTTGTAAGVVLTVANSGPVIPPDRIDQLFEPFHRFGRQRVHNPEGHGLGLAIVRAIADAHGASITARPRVRGGLEVEVRIPAAAPAPASNAPPASVTPTDAVPG